MENRCIQGLESLPTQVCGGVLTIGNFDGVHLGHQVILQAAKTLAAAEGLAVVAMTFDPPPDLVVRPGDLPQRLLPHMQKCQLMRTAGADWVLTVKSEPAMLAMLPEEFVQKVVVDRLAPKHLVEGDDFRFGRQRKGDVQTLQQLGRRAGFTVHVVPPVTLSLAGGTNRVSSSLIRWLITGGKVDEAARCLGRDFALYGHVTSGQGHGRLLQFPTANINPAEQVIPADGVYAGWAKVAGRRYLAAISVGNKPTLGPVNERAVEAFLIDAEKDCYGMDMKLGFVARLRDQERFSDVAALQKQIAEDVSNVRRICR